MFYYRISTFSLITIVFLFNVIYSVNNANGGNGSGSSGKKKVVIVGEMSDFLANETSRVDEYYEDYEDDYNDDLNHNRMRRGNHGSRYRETYLPTHIAPYIKKKSTAPMFVPVAAYSVTKTAKKPSRSYANSYRKRQGSQSIRRNPTAMASKHTESAVYGYMQRPEIIEFRGQYFYGPRPGEETAPNGARHPGMEGGMETAQTQQRPAITDPALNPALNPFAAATGGLGPGSLLLATLPLILAPMLSYLFTPMIIPITATVAAGRRKRDTFDNSASRMTRSQSNMEPSVQKLLNDGSFGTKSAHNTHTTGEWQAFDRLDDSRIKEAQVVAKYLSKVQFDEKATTRAVANYLQCDGMLADSDHCIERLSCEFSDPSNVDAPQLDRAVTSIILSHILANEYITESFKVKLKYAAVYGKDNSGKCGNKYDCNKVE